MSKNPIWEITPGVPVNPRFLLWICTMPFWTSWPVTVGVKGARYTVLLCFKVMERFPGYLDTLGSYRGGEEGLSKISSLGPLGWLYLLLHPKGDCIVRRMRHRHVLEKGGAHQCSFSFVLQMESMLRAKRDVYTLQGTIPKADPCRLKKTKILWLFPYL